MRNSSDIHFLLRLEILETEIPEDKGVGNQKPFTTEEISATETDI